MEQTKTLLPRTRSLAQIKQVTLLTLCAITLVIILPGEGWLTYLFAFLLTIVLYYVIYYVVRFFFFLSWEKQHKKIIKLLDIAKEDYYELAFARKKRKNFFEIIFLGMEGIKLDTSEEVDNSDAANDHGQYNAKHMLKQAKQRLEKTRYIVGVMKKAKLYPEDESLICNKIAAGNFKAAYPAISEAKQKRKRIEAEIEEIKQQAKKARCFPVLLHEFENKKFDPEKARELILRCRQVRNQAKIYDILKSVDSELESGDLTTAKSLVLEAEANQRKAKQKSRELAAIDRRIDALDYVHQPALRAERIKLGEKEHGTKEYNVLWHKLNKALKDIEKG